MKLSKMNKRSQLKTRLVDSIVTQKPPDQSLANLVHELTSLDRIEVLRRTFYQEMIQAQKNERDWCDYQFMKYKRVVSPCFTTNVVEEINNKFVQRCKSPFELRALSKMLYERNYIPNSFDEIAEECEFIKNGLLRS